MSAHICTEPGCGLLHDMPAPPGESEAITLARIAAQQAVDVARIESSATKHVADIQAEAAADVAETVADAEVESAVAEAELLGDAIEASDTDPAEIIVPPAEPVADEEPEDAPPPAEGSPVPETHRKGRGLGMWLWTSRNAPRSTHATTDRHDATVCSYRPSIKPSSGRSCVMRT